jgi:hypothetical protein
VRIRAQGEREVVVLFGLLVEGRFEGQDLGGSLILRSGRMEMSPAEGFLEGSPAVRTVLAVHLVQPKLPRLDRLVLRQRILQWRSIMALAVTNKPRASIENLKVPLRSLQ